MNDVTAALADASQLVDEAIVSACGPLVTGDERPNWSGWEIDQSLRDIERLKGGDCCYDRPSIGVAYALWHHGPRTHDAIRMLLPVIERHGSEEMRVVDLGCGTGATTCAAALIVDAMRRAGRPVPQALTVVGVDQSNFMTDAARRIVDCLLASIDALGVAGEFVAARWEELTPVAARTVITAGYLLDHSDVAHVDEIAERLESLAGRIDAEELILTTVGTKRDVLTKVAAYLINRDWRSLDNALAAPVAGRDFHGCARLRKPWYRDNGVAREPPGYFDRVPRWQHAGAQDACALYRPPGPAGATLFDSAPDGLELDDAQREAAVPNNGPTAIVGPAGSGKTLVLAERVAMTITDPRADPALRILVTAFNNEVVDLLKQGVAEALQRRGVSMPSANTDGHSYTAGPEAKIWFYNRDKLPTRVFGVARSSDIKQSDKWQPEVTERLRGVTDGDADRAKEFSARFLETEFERFIVAKGHLTREAYVEALRPGSGRALGDRQKELIWKLVMEPPIESHGLQRLRALGRAASRTFSHVFVDECQDFGEAELRHLAHSAVSVQRLCIAGDTSQSIHLGPSYHRPTFDGTNWRRRRLEGSHRLPLRICEALHPQAEYLVERRSAADSADTDAVLLGPRKASVLGVRPVVVRAEDLLEQLPAILATYAAEGDAKRLLVADAQDWIRRKVRAAAASWDITEGSMLEFKGCEWPVVVVSDAWAKPGAHEYPDSDAIETLEQHVFTSLTRTTRLLVIALASDRYHLPGVTRFLRRTPMNRLLFWSEEAKLRFTKS